MADKFTCRICGESARMPAIVAREMMLGTRDEFDYRTLVKQAKHIFDTKNATRAIRQGRKKITLL